MTSDLLWFRAGTSYWTAITGGLGANSVIMADVTANATNLLYGALPTDRNLRGMIEHIAIYAGTAAPTLAGCSIAFFSSGSTPSDTVANNHYIDHEPFASGDYIEMSNHATQIQFQGKNDLALPYFDKTGSKEFHIGVIAGTPLGGLDAPDGFVVEFAFRPNRGGG